MAIFDADGPVDFRNLPDLAILNDAATAYSGVSAGGFTADNGDINIFALGTGITEAGGVPVDGAITYLGISRGGFSLYTLSLSLAPVDLSDLKARIDLAPPGDMTEVLAWLFAQRDIIAAAAGNHADWLRGFGGDDEIWGYGGNDVLHGDDGDDKLYGGNGKDKLFGGAGDDILDGGKGFDKLDGGADFDVADYSSAKKSVVVKLVEGKKVIAKVGGKDEDSLKSIEGIFGGKVGDKLTGDKGSNWLVGNEGNDVLKGGGGMDALEGGDGNDKLFGGNGDDDLMGGRGDDFLDGGKGNDQLLGGLGNDILKGGKGADEFFFDTALNAKTNVDTILDFKAGEDVIKLSKAIFSAFANIGAMSADNFVTGRKAKDADDWIIYDKKSGKLFYDADGDGNAYGKVLFARLDNKADLSAGDFTIIA